MNRILRILARRHIRQLIILLALDGVVFGGSNAKTVPSYMLMVGFALLLATVYHLVYCLLAARRLALYLTGLAGVVVALQTIGELSPRDMAVLLPLAGLAYLYSSYSVARKNASGA